MKHIPGPQTGLEEMTDRALLKILEDCNGEDSPIFIECLRRLLRALHYHNAVDEVHEAISRQEKGDLNSRQMRHDEIKRATMPEDYCHWENEKGERVD